MRRWLARHLLLLWLPALGLPLTAHAEPYLALANGFDCGACHVNATGGGLRNDAGMAYAKYALPANPLPEALAGWNGRLGDFLRLGGDLRSSVSRTRIPTQPSQSAAGLDQLRAYADLQLIAGRLDVYVDETLAPGNAQVQEGYLRLSGTLADAGWTLKAGQFYLPFGWRLQDNTAFVREVSGIGMTTPDKGVELGVHSGAWTGQLALSNGPGNAGTGSGHQLTGQLAWVQDWGRIGLAAASTTSKAGNRQVAGLFGGLHTGPLVWLGEVDLVGDDGFPDGRRTQLAALGEVNWQWRQGHNLKLTAETFDPDRHVANDQKARQSLLYEYTPLPFVQLRAGVRRYAGIPQNHPDNRRLVFVEVHGFF